jgi:hypothetical protein
MISKDLLSQLSKREFLNQCYYFGIAMNDGQLTKPEMHTDLERFFLAATYHFDNSRICEGILCWLRKYTYLLSPSKVRRLISNGVPYDKAILGGFLFFITENKMNHRQWAILKIYSKKNKISTPLYPGPKPKLPNQHFMKYNVIVHNFELNENKFLQPVQQVFRKCIEIKNRTLFGSIVHADVASYLSRNPSANAYEVSKETANHKARVFKIHNDVRTAMSATAN